MLSKEQQDRQNARQRAWYARNKEKSKAATLAWRAAHPEESRAHYRAYYARNRVRVIERTKAYAAANADKLRVYQRAYNGVPEATRPCPSHCECCGRLPGRRGLVRDHDYETNAFRGWICDDCNLGLGKIGDTLEAARNLVKYLERAECQMKPQELQSSSQGLELQLNSETSRPVSPPNSLPS
jgi:Recombination endonuclease VII